jgi:hypothetical protein
MYVHRFFLYYLIIYKTLFTCLFYFYIIKNHLVTFVIWILLTYVSMQNEYLKVCVGYHLISLAHFRDIAFSIMNENSWFKFA